jgi:hypothetical protein|tara:strand:+ start:468 stop:644 length:177 start_codon:yes stop_codon:yes gene_type:complete
MTVTVLRRVINGKKGKWELDSIYTDGMPGGKKREKEYAENFKDEKNKVEYKVEVTKNE